MDEWSAPFEPAGELDPKFGSAAFADSCLLIGQPDSAAGGQAKKRFTAFLQPSQRCGEVTPYYAHVQGPLSVSSESVLGDLDHTWMLPGQSPLRSFYISNMSHAMRSKPPAHVFSHVITIGGMWSAAAETAAAAAAAEAATG